MTEKEELFIAILTDTATPGEKDQFRELMELGENRLLFDQVKKIWEEAPHVKKYKQVDSKRVFSELAQKIETKNRTRKKYFTISMISAAAGILFMTGLFTLYSNLFNKTAAETSVMVQTELGNRSFVVLPDSSKVWLNSKSQIRYQANFGKTNRKVFLTGEGFFDVTHHDKPFIVNVSEFEILVHGTRFNVSAYPDEKKIYTSLESGKISIQKDEKEDLRIEPGQLVIYDKSTSTFNLNKVNVSEYSSWRQNEMYMHAEALQVLANKLERKYNVEIVFVPEELGNNIHYSGVFTDENIEEILDAISIASDLTYTKKGNRYTIKIKQ